MSSTTVHISDRLRTLLRTSEEIVAFTGAGISAESGVPTFRGEDGLWKKFRPEELATFDAFMRNPELVWEWYLHRKRVIAEIQPNAGHRALAEMEQIFRHVTVVTQNIDNLHRRAGSSTVVELHGNIERNYCTGCGKFADNAEVLAAAGVPRCRSCHALLRPDVVWFGEELPADEWNAAMRAVRRADICLVIGTSAIVYPAASIPYAAMEAGAYIIEVNTERTELTSRADEVFPGKSGEILPELAALARELRTHSQPNV